MGIPLLLAFSLPVVQAQQLQVGLPLQPPASVPSRVATDLPVSGKDESSGKPAEDGAQLAVTQANANHTVPGLPLYSSKRRCGPEWLA